MITKQEAGMFLRELIPNSVSDAENGLFQEFTLDDGCVMHIKYDEVPGQIVVSGFIGELTKDAEELSYVMSTILAWNFKDKYCFSAPEGTDLLMMHGIFDCGDVTDFATFLVEFENSVVSRTKELKELQEPLEDSRIMCA